MQETSLSDGEWKIMKVLWEKSPCTITELVGLLKAETSWGKHTVITMLGRMGKKGAVRYEEGSKSKLFFPLVEKDVVSIEETKGFLEKVYGGSLSMMVNSMVEQKSLTKEEVEELYGILRRADKKQADN